MPERLRIQIDCDRLLHWAAKRRALRMNCSVSEALAPLLRANLATELKEAERHFQETKAEQR